MGYKTSNSSQLTPNKNELMAEKLKSIDRLKNRIQPQYLPEHFSYSQLAAFEKCPLQYKFAFILKVPTRGKAVFSFGKTMHNTLYDFLKFVNEEKTIAQTDLFGEKTTKKTAKKDKNKDFEELTKLYEKNWIDEWYGSKSDKEAYYKKGKETIKNFYQEYIKNPPKILKINGSLALEMSFNLKIGEHTLFGVIDRIDQMPKGVVIIDYKTGQSKEKPDKEQLLIYQIAAQEVLHLKPKQLAYYYLDDGKFVSFLGSEKELSAQKEKIIEEIGKIKNSEFEPTPGWQCQYCDFKDICDFAQK
jgi:DNA helicase-2/ATP-dependent DNA helicase PcrA